MKLWVDDVRPAPKGWIWAKSYKQAMRLMEENDWDFDVISLDYDLGEEKTGYDLLCKIEQRSMEYMNYTPLIGVHTSNMIVRDKMCNVASRLNGRRLRR
ncbi:MAG: hypothetical protein DRP83_00185 [Planctomycetota bacterium]|nr:MAG: hypothetical protein DRP83_00185 [Planctomycetota bacterium]